jgi:hypothetical protein
VDTHDPLDFLRAIGGVPVECFACAVPVARRKLDLLGRDQPIDWLKAIGAMRTSQKSQIFRWK